MGRCNPQAVHNAPDDPWKNLKFDPSTKYKGWAVFKGEVFLQGRWHSFEFKIDDRLALNQIAALPKKQRAVLLDDLVLFPVKQMLTIPKKGKNTHDPMEMPIWKTARWLVGGLLAWAIEGARRPSPAYKRTLKAMGRSKSKMTEWTGRTKKIPEEAKAVLGFLVAKNYETLCKINPARFGSKKYRFRVPLENPKGFFQTCQNQDPGLREYVRVLRTRELRRTYEIFLADDKNNVWAPTQEEVVRAGWKFVEKKNGIKNGKKGICYLYEAMQPLPESDPVHCPYRLPLPPEQMVMDILCGRNPEFFELPIKWNPDDFRQF